MKIQLKEYTGDYRIVSLALDDETKEDLLEDKLDFLYLKDQIVWLYPDQQKYKLEPKEADYLKTCNNYDCFGLNENGTLSILYNADSVENFFYITGKCNSNCIMCPSPEVFRRKAKVSNIDEHILLAQHIPCSAPHLTITGGEPFMAGEEIFRLLQFLKDKFTATEFLILTNGRIFSVQDYVDKLIDSLPSNSILAIPVHGSTAEVHDGITRAKDSFAQTISGIKNLLTYRIRVELRIVISQLNLLDFEKLAYMIVDELKEIEYISIIAMEMTGNAYINRESLWLPYSEVFQAIVSSVEYLVNHDIDVRLYNFPLCTVSPRFWPICKKSISPNKVRYASQCTECRFKEDCGGVFAGTMLLEKQDLRVIS